MLFAGASRKLHVPLLAELPHDVRILEAPIQDNLYFESSLRPRFVGLGRKIFARLGPAESAVSVVRLQAAELVKWRFRHGQVLAWLDRSGCAVAR